MPFDQWLLSERNIKLALYSGGFLLLLAGLIFVGVRWAYLPGIAKLGVTLAVTLGMYAGGVVLFKRPTLKIGGTALLAIASGFLPLNFVVTHLYLTSERGVSAETIWLVASLGCGAVYVLTALGSRNNVFTVFALLGILSSATAAMALLHFDVASAAFGYAILALAVLLTAYNARVTSRFQFMALTLRIGAHIFAPVVFLLATIAWVSTWTIASMLHNSWFALDALLLIVAFYVLDDWWSHSLYARWGAAFAFGIAATLICTELRLSSIQTGVVLKLLAAMYLLGGKFLQRGKKLEVGLPLYAVSVLLALFVTAQAMYVYTQTPEHLALALVGDVALLGIAAYLFRRVEFVYGGAWLVLAPVLIYGNIYLPNMTARALAFGAVMLVDASVGFYFAPRI